MNGIKETCKCGHDKATHFLWRDYPEDSTKQYITCLAINCDCKKYKYEESKHG